MKWSVSALSAALLLALTSQHADAFVVVSKPVVLQQQPTREYATTTRRSVHSNYHPFRTQPLHMTSSSSSSSSSSPQFTVGIVGATGAVGKEIKQCLERRGFPTSRLTLFGSERSAGQTVDDNDANVIELFSVERARQCDIVFLAVSGEFAKQYACALTQGEDGCVCIDNSSAFRYDKNIPLVIPEINGHVTKQCKLIANPNCTTAIALMVLWPLHQLFGLKRVIVSTYQAASGAGQPGMDELQHNMQQWVRGETMTNTVFAHPLPFNVIPHIDVLQDNGYTKEEMKVCWETRKICALPDDFPVSCTAVRIPTLRAHAESIVLETERPVDLDQARDALRNAPGVELVDDVNNKQYPMPLKATGQDNVQVGRLRHSIVFDRGLELFVCGDQLLRGAALNAVLIAEEMIRNGSIQQRETVQA